MSVSETLCISLYEMQKEIGIFVVTCMSTDTIYIFRVLCIEFIVKYKIKPIMQVMFLFDLILYVPSSIFQLCRDGSSCVEPVLS